jgi:hypothetical protein
LIFLRLRLGVGTIQKERHDLLENLLANIHGSMDAIAGLNPIHFPYRDLPRQSFSAVAELDLQQISAQNYRYPVIGIVVPGCGFARRQPLPPDKTISAVMQYSLLAHRVTV